MSAEPAARMVGLLALAHDRCCEAALAARLAKLLETGTLRELEPSRASSSASKMRRKASRGKQLIAVDQMQQCHRLAAQGMDEMVVVDHVAAATIAVGATAAQGHQWGRANEQLQPIIVEVDAQGVTDQP